MINKIKMSDNKELIMISKNVIVCFIVFLLILTLLLVVLFSTTDFDSLLGTKDLAIKVGETAISIKDFKTIQAISGAKAQVMSPSEFANNLVDVLLLSEEGKRLGLNHTPNFTNQISEFAQSLPVNSDTDKIAKSIFMIEELSKTTRKHIIDNMPQVASNMTEIDNSDYVSPKLRLKTILVKTMPQAIAVLEEASLGKSFEELNASWSSSLYRFVGGDLGWREASDLPDGLFEKLKSLPIASLTIGLEDEYGIHLFTSASQQKEFVKLSQTSTKTRVIANQKSNYLKAHINKLRKDIDYYICPGLRNNYKMKNIQ